MKIAVVCDDLIQFGGAEKVFLKVAEIFPEADLYTTAVSKKWQKVLNEKNLKVKTSFLQKFPFVEKLNRVYSVFLLHILAIQSFDFSKYDTVLSLTARYAHFAITKPSTRHICYMHSPGRMFWEPFDYFENENFGILSKLLRALLALPLLTIRILDYLASRSVDIFYGNSKTATSRIKRYYGLDSQVLYPFIKYKDFKDIETKEGDYYLVVTRLVGWKKVDIAIKACEELKHKLVVVGEGPDLKRLKSISGQHTEFTGYISGEKFNNLMGGCKAVIITQKEDFGLVPLEAMACGKPVIAFGKGGVLETVIPGKTGEFFNEQTSESLKKLLMKFNPKKYSLDECKTQAEKFDVSFFEKRIKNIVYLLSPSKK